MTKFKTEISKKFTKRIQPRVYTEILHHSSYEHNFSCDISALAANVRD